MDDRLRAGTPSCYVTSHSGQLSLLPSVGREMIQTKVHAAMMRCDRGVKAVWLIPFVSDR